MAPWNAGKIPKGTSFGKKKTKKSKKQTGSTPPTVEPTIKKKKKGSETGQAKKNVAETGHKKSKERVKAQVDKLKKKKPKWVGWGIAIPKAEVVQTANEMKQLKKTIEEQALCIANQKESIEALKTQVKASGTESRTELGEANKLIETQEKLIETQRKRIETLEKNAMKASEESGSASFQTKKKSKKKDTEAPEESGSASFQKQKNATKAPEKPGLKRKRAEPANIPDKEPEKPPGMTQLNTITTNTINNTPTWPKGPEWYKRWKKTGVGGNYEMHTAWQNAEVTALENKNNEVWKPPPKKRHFGVRLSDPKPNSIPRGGPPKDTFTEEDVGKRFVIKIEGRIHPVVMRLLKIEKDGMGGWFNTQNGEDLSLIPPEYCRPVKESKK
jgi:hypothetical protein